MYNAITDIFLETWLLLLYSLCTDLIKDINDPEHPLTLEELNVLQLKHVYVCESDSSVIILFTPTIPHCSMATLIGLSIKVRLLRALPERFKVNVNRYYLYHGCNILSNYIAPLKSINHFSHHRREWYYGTSLVHCLEHYYTLSSAMSSWYFETL